MPLTIRPDESGPGEFARAADLIRNGGIVVFPTETVYGIGADIRCPEAVARASRLKRNPPGKPLLVHCAAGEQLAGLTPGVPENARRLMDAFWPGPIALLLPASSSVPPVVTAGTGTVGIRMVAHPVFRRFCLELDAPLAGSSANLHGGQPPHLLHEVDTGLLSTADVVLDAGECGPGIPSTVIDLSGAEPRLLREGAVSRARVEQALGLTLDRP